MKKDNDGLWILVTAFALFFSLATMAIAIENAAGTRKNQTYYIGIS